jgi:hypothetical protein
MSDWIKCSEQMPEAYTRVKLRYPDGAEDHGEWCDYTQSVGSSIPGEWSTDNGLSLEGYDPCEWMPLERP